MSSDHECTCQYCINKRNEFKSPGFNPYYEYWGTAANRLYWMDRIAATGWILFLLAAIALVIETS